MQLWKGVYKYEYIDDCEKFNEKSLPGQEDFSSHLNIKDINDAGLKGRKSVCEAFEIKHLGQYHDLSVQSSTLLVAGVFNNFWNMCLKIHGFDPTYFLSALGLVCEAAIKKTKIKLDLLTDINMSLKIEKGVRGGMCHAIHQYGKANNKYIKLYDKK